MLKTNKNKKAKFGFKKARNVQTHPDGLTFAQALRKKQKKAGYPVIMMAVTPTVKFKQAALDMPLNWAERRKLVLDIQTACTTNAYISFTATQLAALAAKITPFITADDNVTNGVSGAVGARLNPWARLNQFLKTTWKTLIQEAADADVDNASIIIESTLYAVAIDPTYAKASIKVLNTTTSGELKFIVYALPLYPAGVTVMKCMEYEQSTNGSVWTMVKGSYAASSTFTTNGFTPRTTMYFRVRAYFSKGRISDWVYSGPIDIK